MKNKFFMFLVSMQGRILRVVLGMFILSFGFEKYPILIIVGLIPLLAGVFDYCVIGPLFGLPFLGKRVREQLNK